jgi:phosphatidylserine/phosphatidylglycerophosphate/cardiolipin synthase-like enzyme
MDDENNIKKEKPKIKKKSRKFFYKFFLLIFLLLFFFGVWHAQLKPLPEGLSIKGETHLIENKDVNFLYDLTYQNKSGERIKDQEIFDRIFTLIEQSKKYILIDMFLFNDYMGGSQEEPHRKLYEELIQALINKKEQFPDIKIDLITDPINRVYSGADLPGFDKLEEKQINIIETNLDTLRDSNPIYSSPWRVFVKFLGSNVENGWIVNPFDKKGDVVGLRNWLKLINFKANHRKLILADRDDDVVVLVTSANPHNGSSAHSNVALEVVGDIWLDVYKNELAVAHMSNLDLSWNDNFEKAKNNRAKYSFPNNKGNNILKVGMITEGKIKEFLIENISKLKSDDSLWMAMFYISERDIVKELINASKRGVEIKIILDSNKDAFGYKKTGIPNRQVAYELFKKSNESIKIRWYITEGEQFHSKIILMKSDQKAIATLGSANLTKRNIGDFNLETNLWVEMSLENSLYQEMSAFFNKVWNNEDKNIYTEDFSFYKENQFWKKIIYRLQESLGVSSF